MILTAAVVAPPSVLYNPGHGLREIIAAEHPGKKIFILGESLGGLIAFNLSVRSPGAFAGQILISPAFKNGMKFPLSSYLTLAANIAVRPRKTIAVPFTAAMCTQDVEKARGVEWVYFSVKKHLIFIFLWYNSGRRIKEVVTGPDFGLVLLSFISIPKFWDAPVQRPE